MIQQSFFGLIAYFLSKYPILSKVIWSNIIPLVGLKEELSQIQIVRAYFILRLSRLNKAFSQNLYNKQVQSYHLHHMGCTSSMDQVEYVDQSRQLSVQKKRRIKSNQYPYNCIGLLQWKIEGQKSKRGFGTGFLIGPNLVLTAAHNLFNKKDLSKINKLKFYPGLDGYRSPVLVLQQSETYSKNYSKPNIMDQEKCEKRNDGYHIKAQHDFALILLEKEIVREHYIMLGFNHKQILRAYISGYPAYMDKIDFQDDELIYYQQTDTVGKIIQTRQNEGEFIHDVTTWGGSSGSPFMVQFQKGAYFAVGIHCKKKYNDITKVACRLSSLKIQTIKTWANQLIEVNREIYSQQLFKFYKDYIQNTLSKNVSQFTIKKDQLEDQSQQKLKRQIHHLQKQIKEERQLTKDYQTLFNIISFNCQAAQKQIQLQTYQQAQKRLEACLDQINACSNQQQMALHILKINLKLGFIFQLVKKKTEAFKCFQKAEGLCLKYHIQSERASVLQAFALYSIAFEECTKGQQYYEKAYEFVKDYDPQDKKHIANLLMNLGNAMLITGKYQNGEPQSKYQQAIKLYGEALKECLKNDKKQLTENGEVILTIEGNSALKVYFEIGCCHYNLGKRLLASERCQQGLDEFKKAFDNFKKAKYQAGQNFQKLVAGFANSVSKYIKSKMLQKLVKNQAVQLQQRILILSIINQILQMFKQQPIRLRSLILLFKQLNQRRTQAYNKN